jgi:hypothetical protein
MVFGKAIGLEFGKRTPDLLLSCKESKAGPYGEVDPLRNAKRNRW